ncbi:N-acetyltransferase [Hymenobacter sp. RP-2-7]|uniref:N-acetyltransferase n=1 Tax=Hymenobacter polaris TaxID=2682546 RepID=A0A7Y0ADV4_9BACT|nr:GNAT family N-acetyltransferase [Hymenobacter polaris]NML65497.1 N-acetyltransferase [Hymenobacter polaris]
MSIHHNPSQHTFTDGQAELAYELPAPGVIDFVHTQVPTGEQGQGVGSALAKAGLDYARQHAMRVVATCPFVASYIQQHAEYADLVK